MKTKIIAISYVIFITLQATIVEAWNEPPTAKIVIADQTVAIGKQVWFDGYQSTDNDENGEKIVAWEWSLPSAAYDTSGENSPYLCCRFKETGEQTITLTVTDDEGQTDQDWVRITVVKPSYETSISCRWGIGNAATMHYWSAHLFPTTVHFYFLTVTEKDYKPASDTCYFAGSKCPKITGVDGDTWYIRYDKTGDYYGYDTIGWGTNAVEYYRDVNRAPCRFTAYQKMVINLPNINKSEPYEYNIVEGIIENSRVGSRREEKVEYRTWP